MWNIFYWENDGILTSKLFNLAWKFHHLEKHRQVFALLVLCFGATESEPHKKILVMLLDLLIVWILCWEVHSPEN